MNDEEKLAFEHDIFDASQPDERSVLRKEIARLRAEADLWRTRCAAAVSMLSGDTVIGDLRERTEEMRKAWAACAGLRPEGIEAAVEALSVSADELQSVIWHGRRAQDEMQTVQVAWLQKVADSLRTAIAGLEVKP